MNDPAFADYADGVETPMPDWIDSDFIEAVVTIGKELHHDHAVQHDHAVGGAAPASRTRSRSGSKAKMAAMAARTRGRRTG